MTPSKGVALVTGSAQGIGCAISLQLALDGYDITLNDVDSKRPALAELASKIESTGRRAHVVVADVADEAQVQTMITEAVAHLGSLDVMVANAGVLCSTMLTETSVEQFDRLMAINVRGTMLCYKYAALQMIAQGRGGRIIGASSVVGKRGSASICAYSASKFAVRGLTQVAAVELGVHGITVNAYAPGSIDTAMLTDFIATAAAVLNTSASQLEDERKSHRVLSRIGTPEDIANLVSFLVSERASYITGQSISCDGGRHFD